MRSTAAVAALALVLAAAPARAQPDPEEVHALVATSFGMRGNQGGVLEGGFRLMIVAAVLTPVLDIGLGLDRQIGADNRVIDAEGDVARWSEWVATLRGGRRFPLTKGFRFQTLAGVALVHSRITGPVDDPIPMEASAYSLGADGALGVAWHSASLVVTLSFGATVVPFEQRLEVGAAGYDLPVRAELWTSLGIGFTL